MPTETPHFHLKRLRKKLSVRVPLVLLALFSASWRAYPGETDQFLTWDVELRDAAAPFNAFLDREIQTFIDRANRRTRPVPDAVTLTEDLYRYLFQGLHASRVRRWLKHDAKVDRYPANELSDLEYQRISIFRKPAFPFFLPMAQTIRVGEVYCGIDKIGHMFGFGRRYLQIYSRHRAQGVAKNEAIEKVIGWGIQHERGVVGKLVDGIFSHGDLEANYQGFRLALAFCEGETPLFYREADGWHYRGGLDIRDYVTPDFDESYNANLYASWRHRQVAPVLSAYEDTYHSPTVKHRFERYRAGWTPSVSKQMIDAHFDDLGVAPHDLCWLEKECSDDGA